MTSHLDLDDRSATLTLTHKQISTITSALLVHASQHRDLQEKYDRGDARRDAHFRIERQSNDLFRELFQHEQALFDAWKDDGVKERIYDALADVDDRLIDAGIHLKVRMPFPDDDDPVQYVRLIKELNDEADEVITEGQWRVSEIGDAVHFLAGCID